MGNQIIKQPDGYFAIFNTNSDTIIVWDATAQEIEDWFVEQTVERTRRDIKRTLGHVAHGQPRSAYFQFTMTWEQALEKDRDHGGEAHIEITQSR